MIGELNFGGVFVPSLLIAAGIAFGLSIAVRLSLRQLHFYRFVWHAGLFDVALFVVLVWATAVTTAKWNILGGN
jgi:hypothetical protein